MCVCLLVDSALVHSNDLEAGHLGVGAPGDTIDARNVIARAALVVQRPRLTLTILIRVLDVEAAREQSKALGTSGHIPIDHTHADRFELRSALRSGLRDALRIETSMPLAVRRERRV